MAGIYVHIPFCKQKCSYCDFHFSTTFTAYRQKMIDAIKTEIDLRKAELDNQIIETVYFGGGTPSLLTFNELSEITKSLHQNYDISDEFEFTLEANPDDINPEQLKNWKNVGVNRLSIGLQSFLQDDLDWMNRAHTAEESVKAVEQAKTAGFSLTVDLIYGLPNRSLQEWTSNIKKLVALRPEHISAYCLTVEKKTALHQMIKKGKLPLVGEEDQANQFELLVDVLASSGYEQYEISNFARNQAFSKHNANYWRNVNYIGIGPSAHSFDGGSRRWNVANNQLYIKGVNRGEDYFETEILTPKDQFNELLLTGLRTKWGVDLNALKFKHCTTKEFEKQVEQFKNDGLLYETSNSLFLTDKGKLQADYVAAMLFIE
ncbi:coproporphyrinogen III oxidase [Brumimicrobium salinarum]|uniref:Heme chaperone HemW n=1 Tax=Brumimicrobium salinarum TaxID=2058658 RepID=A0A2I0R6B0_9FLAO|nr:radical SAM family heme chaperone HemW [Brumimicrobium salinarum]PKR82123.1 coproporphyrinogen III oxidase [Brumimicrobium salinarum]